MGSGRSQLVRTEEVLNNPASGGSQRAWLYPKQQFNTVGDLILVI